MAEGRKSRPDLRRSRALVVEVVELDLASVSGVVEEERSEDKEKEDGIIEVREDLLLDMLGNMTGKSVSQQSRVRSRSNPAQSSPGPQGCSSCAVLAVQCNVEEREKTRIAQQDE